MKKFLKSFAFLPLFLLAATPAFAFPQNFTVSNAHLNLSTNEFSFDYTGTDLSGSTIVVLAQDVNNPQYANKVGTLCNASHCSGTFDTFPNPYPSGSTMVEFGTDIGPGKSNTFMLSSILDEPTPSVKIVADPASGAKTVGTPFNVDIKIEEDNADAFNAVRATVSVSSNLSITGIHSPASNACNLQYTQTPTISNPSFAGAIFNGSSTGCTVYTLTLIPTAEGTGTISFTNGSVKSYDDNSEILTDVENASFTISDGPTPTPTPILDFTIDNQLLTYNSSFTLFGTKLSTLTHIYVNGSDVNSTYPTSTTWENAVALSLGSNNFTLYGSDDNSNQTATQTITVNRHTLGDINGDGDIDLIDASLFAIDWDKTEDLTYILSDMNEDGIVDLTDLSILAKLID